MRFDRIDSYVRARWLGSPDIAPSTTRWNYRFRGILIRVGERLG
jgi:hypothetical protein